ncbi:MAG: Maf family protein [Epsilonproteobacteria bacterium]|nr:Maf family protein [Campylobacterota bacterium]
MSKQDILYLASQSPSRQRLLKHARIQFKTLEHGSDERSVVHRFNFDEYVIDIAKDKMRTVKLPHTSEHEDDVLFVLTADSMARDEQENEVFGKPENIEDAHRMVKIIGQRPIQVVTGCCLYKFKKVQGAWERTDAVEWSTQALVEFYIDPDMIETYFEIMPAALHACGASIIEEYGYSFLKSVQGSFTTILGLPVYQLRQALKKLDFRF